MALSDPYLLQALKVQIQIEGAPMVSSATYAATLHYQIAYRVQNHALDVIIPGLEHEHQDSLIIQVDDSKVPVCTHAPKQLSKEQLLQLLPEKWQCPLFDTRTIELTFSCGKKYQREDIWRNGEGKLDYHATTETT
ncbi:hypothetical protein ACLOJK_011964 [Asimina triloba]